VFDQTAHIHQLCTHDMCFTSQEKLQPQSVNNTVNKVRSQLWDILNRLPHSEVLQPYATQLVKLAMQMVQLENEDNAIICVRTIFDLHKVRSLLCAQHYY
jgi:GTP1/Obg family GTP-binding protein